MCPYCVGSGYAMGFRQGAELTSLEQRWVATRTKDFCGPVDTISVGYGAPIVDARRRAGLMSRYAHLGGERRAALHPRRTRRWKSGWPDAGPAIATPRTSPRKRSKAMMEDYLNERPSFVLFLASRGQDVTREPIEIYGSDP